MLHVRVLTVLLAVVVLGSPGAAAAAKPPASWPPAKGPGLLVAHFGEEHLNDDDGERILPNVVAEVARYKPAIATTSADKGSNGVPEQFAAYKEVMAALERASVPYFSALGNHDRTAPPGVPGGFPGVTDFAPYRAAFADRPFPWGDGPPVSDPRFAPISRPVSDTDGASTHYAVDVGNVRWVFLDNSCYSLINCDPFQAPAFPDDDGNGSQYDYLRSVAGEAKREGRLVFVVFHMPTQDDRPGHTNPTPAPHTMGEGTSPDNATFEQVAAELDVDAVFAGHIKGQWMYRGQGDVPYYTDGGAGGEVYVSSEEEVGVDSGYWHGFRLLRIVGSKVTTDVVPAIVPDGITVKGPPSVKRGEVAVFTATAKQPTEEGPKIDALELREPDPSRSNAAKLPTPARIWTTGNRRIVAPVAAKSDDARRDPATQTVSGRFAGRCPGRTAVSITSGFQTRRVPVVVPSAPGKLLRSVKPRRRPLPAGRRATVATVRLAQPVRLRATVRRGARVVATLIDRCGRAKRPIAVRWNGRGTSGRRVAAGRYTLDVRLRSDRRTLVRRFKLGLR
ncbi:MAG: metallophosphoesterase [Solirubrobacteraceae bacterium]